MPVYVPVPVILCSRPPFSPQCPMHPHRTGNEVCPDWEVPPPPWLLPPPVAVMSAVVAGVVMVGAIVAAVLSLVTVNVVMGTMSVPCKIGLPAGCFSCGWHRVMADGVATVGGGFV